MLLRTYVVVSAMILLVLQGCVAVQTFPTAARAGDTITLAVGSPDGMTKSNTTAQFVSSSLGNPVDLPIRSIIKIRPDNTSFVGAFDAMTDYLATQSSHSAWLSIIVIDLPAGLPVGAANINISTLGQYKYGANVNDIPIGINILSGTGSPNPFIYNPSGSGTVAGDLSELEALPQVVVKPPFVSDFGNIAFSAAEIRIHAPSHIKSTGLPIPDGNIKVIADDMSKLNGTSQKQMFWSQSGDDYSVYFVNSKKGSYVQTRFSIVLYPDPNYEFIPGNPPVVTSVTYYDFNGNIVSGMPGVSDYTVSLE